MRSLVNFLFLGLFLSLFSCGNEKLVRFSAKGLHLGINSKGLVATIENPVTGKNHLSGEMESPFLSLYDSTFIHPEGLSYDDESKILMLSYPNGSEARIQAEEKGDYLRFEVISVEPRNNVTRVVWGPYVTSIVKTIGETVCVVQDDHFSFGMQSLEVNTTEGPAPDGFIPNVIDPLPGQTLPDSLKDAVGTPGTWNVFKDGDIPSFVRQYRGKAAVKMPYGSVLTLNAKNWRTDNRPELDLMTDNTDFVGSSIAMFGCSKEETLDVIEKIELGEGLPRIIVDGEWIKRSSRQGESYMSMSFNINTVDKAVEYAKRFGFRMIHMGDIFESWGHFGLKTSRFPNGVSDLKKVATKLKEEDIIIGPHTLTMFTQKHDPYVSPVPSDSLMKSGRSRITEAIETEDDVIFVEDAGPFRNPDRTHTVKIGKELINYSQLSDDAPWRLLDCQRGVYNTNVLSHDKGAYIDKLKNDDYSGFFPDIHLQDEYADRFAEICNLTGIQHLDFDGYGAGYYGANKFIKRLYDQLNEKNVIICGAGPGHYYWHLYTQMNWGEPWYDNVRESMINYRIENVRYFNRNLTKGMLGWFMIQKSYRPEENEFIQALSTGWDAGYLLYLSESDLEENAFTDKHFNLVKDWQDARKAKVFNERQLEAMRDRYKSFHLERMSKTKWKWYPVAFDYKNEIRYKGHSKVTEEFIFENPHAEQPAEFYLRALSETIVENDVRRQRSVNKNAEFKDITVTINGEEIKIPFAIRFQENIHFDGNDLSLCDLGWHKLQTIPVEAPLFKKGKNRIIVTGAFDGENGPVINCEFKTMGSAEIVQAK